MGSDERRPLLEARGALTARPLAVDGFVTECRSRTPFRFGAVTVTQAPLLTLRVRAEVDGQEVSGFASDLLVPRWFRKDVERPAAVDGRELARSAHRAGVELLREPAGENLFEHWKRVWTARVESVPFESPDRLERGFGVALVERALIDAVCRAANVSFAEALRCGALGIPRELTAHLPKTPLASIAVRHTVGMLDALRDRDVAPARAVRDGLPESLEAEIRYRGIRQFKLKLSGDVAVDRARLLAVWGVIEESCPSTPRISLDGNEQFDGLAPLARLLDELARDESGARLLRHVTHLEQPTPRARSFQPDPAIADVREHAPLILDEADVGVEAFERAFELGYRGVSVKNCKGVIRALQHRASCARLGDGAFQTGEDLTNLPVLALQQDLATMAALGVDGVERNGHHYFAGLSHLPKSEVAAALARHGDLYEPWRDSAALRIVDGALDVRSLQCAGYGYDVAIDVGARTNVDGHFAELDG